MRNANQKLQFIFKFLSNQLTVPRVEDFSSNTAFLRQTLTFPTSRQYVRGGDNSALRINGSKPVYVGWVVHCMLLSGLLEEQLMHDPNGRHSSSRRPEASSMVDLLSARGSNPLWALDCLI